MLSKRTKPRTEQSVGPIERRSSDVLDISPEDLARFKSFINKTETCWEWTGSTYKDRHGNDTYGRFSYLGKKLSAHKLSYQIHHGDIAAGMVVMHSCDNPVCVNPEHLSLGTYLDNIRDKVSKGRAKGGTRMIYKQRKLQRRTPKPKVRKPAVGKKFKAPKPEAPNPHLDRYQQTQQLLEQAKQRRLAELERLQKGDL